MIDWKEIQRYYDLGHSRKECLEKFNCSSGSWTIAIKAGKIHQRFKKLPNTNAKDLTGEQFGMLTVISLHTNKKRDIKWNCQCECGNICIKTSTNLIFESKSCGCLKTLCGEKSKCWKGYKDISLTYFTSCIYNAQSRDIEFNVSIEYIWDVFISQDRRCKLSGVPLTFSTKKEKHTASLDRIDSTIGYVKGNIQWVHKIINRMKTDMPQEIFIDFAKKVYYNSKIIKT